MTTSWIRAVVVLGLVAWIAGCGGGGGETSAPAAPAPTAGPPTIGAAGGTASDASGASIVVPAGALATDTTIRVAIDSTGAPALPAGLVAAGSTYVVTPHGGEFAQPVEVRIPAPNVTLQPNEELRLAKAQPGGEWEVLGNTRLLDGKLVAQVGSFSFFIPVIIIYPLPLAQFVAYQVSTSLDCGGQVCSQAVGTVTATFTFTGNGGQVPSNCTNPALTFREGTALPLSFSANGPNLPISGGVITRSVRVPTTLYSPRWSFGVAVRCNYTMGIGDSQRRIFWKSPPAYPAVGIYRTPVQIDVVEGLPAGVDAVLEGGATQRAQQLPYGFAPPTSANRAVLDWQRSDDQGASWRLVARSYQDEANPDPLVMSYPWRYWGVRHGFIAAAADQGALIRVLACYTPPDVPPPPCVTSTPTRINVLQQSALPTFVQAPSAMLIRSGQTASFTVAAAGLPAPSLQWQTRAANAAGAWANVSTGAGATTANYTTPVLSTADNGTQYRVVASNATGSAESAAVSVSVSDLDVAPTITAQPAGLSVTAGNDAAFAIAARGTEALSYQWSKDGVPINGANSPVLRLAAVSVGQAGAYSVTVSNAAGTLASNPATLTVSAGTAVAVAPSIVTQPVSVLVNAGNTATFAVGASGSGTLSYQWLRNGQPVVSATAAFYSIAQAAVGDAATYAVQVSNGVGPGVTSFNVVLTVNQSAQPTAVAIGVQPSPQVQAPGGSVTFAVAASGSGPIAYQWLKNSVPIAGATTAVLTLAGITGNDAADYSVSVNNPLGTATSNPAKLTVLDAPLVSTQPAAASVNEGGRASFTVAASGSGLLYQWTRNQGAIAGATTASYTTPALALADSGAVYGVIVFNGAGLVFSQGAVLTVTAVPTGKLALVANSSANTLSILRADPNTGALTALGSTGAGSFPYAVAITPNGLFAFVTNLVGNNVSSYSIDTTTGAVALVGISVNSVNPYGIAMDPLGRFTWVANYSASTVSAYSINGATGQLTAAGSPVATGTLPYAVAAHPSGNFVYVANEVGNSVSAFSVNTSTGALSLLAGTIANSVFRPHAITVHPSGRFVYVAESGGSSVAAFRVNASTGVLSAPTYANTGTSPTGVAVHPNGQFVYVTTSRGVSTFSINGTTGALTEIGSPNAAGSNPAGLAINATGTHLYVTDQGGNSASGFGIDATTGALASLGAAVSTGRGPIGIAITP